MSAFKDFLLRPMTAEKEGQLTDKQKAVRQHLRRRALIESIFGVGVVVATLVALAYKSFAMH